MVTRTKVRSKKKTKDVEPEVNVNNPFVQSLIYAGDFATIIATDLLSPDVATGDVVWVAGVKAVPIEDDPYTQRIVMIVHRVLDDHIMSKQLYVIDPAGLEKVSEDRRKELSHQLELDFPTTIKTDASVN